MNLDQSTLFIIAALTFLLGLLSFFLIRKMSQKDQRVRKKLDQQEKSKEQWPDLNKKKSPKTLDSALSSTRASFVGRLMAALSHTGSEEKSAIVEKVEEILFTADIGVKTSNKLLEMVKEQLNSSDVPDMRVVQTRLRQIILKMLSGVQTQPIEKNTNPGPKVFMFVGVNGVGKTTSIGKLAAQLASDGKSVVLGAGDTFRAAAAEQLEIWANRAGCEIVRGEEKSDPSAVLFDAVVKAKNKNADYVLCDTAGRLHTKINLMEELKKVHRVLGKACENAPHEVLLVVDATTGQNALEQARQFKEASALTGVILTKLDGSAKGGIVIGIADELKIPIRYIGVGEGATDLRAFNAQEFVDALFEENS